MLTRKAIRKAQDNATLTRSGRLIVRNENGCLYDVKDEDSVAQRLRRKGHNVLATVSWDGMVERKKGGRK